MGQHCQYSTESILLYKWQCSIIIIIIYRSKYICMLGSENIELPCQFSYIQKNTESINFKQLNLLFAYHNI